MDQSPIASRRKDTCSACKQEGHNSRNSKCQSNSYSKYLSFQNCKLFSRFLHSNYSRCLCLCITNQIPCNPSAKCIAFDVESTYLGRVKDRIIQIVALVVNETSEIELEEEFFFSCKLWECFCSPSAFDAHHIDRARGDFIQYAARIRRQWKRFWQLYYL